MIYECPVYQACPWQGSAEEIRGHFQDVHTNFYSDTNAIEILFRTLPQHKILHLKDEIFLLQCQMMDGKLSLRLRYLGSNDEAIRYHYNVTILVKGLFYKYHPSRYFSCIVPTKDAWLIDIECLEKFHGSIDKIDCVILINFPELINEEEVIKDLEFVQNRIEILKREQSVENNEKEDLETNKKIESFRNRESVDAMDKISLLNLNIFESCNMYEDETDSISDSLPNIPKEIDLHCASCKLEMIPPIYLCNSAHNVCNSCRKLPCKLCNAPITEARNTDLEDISRAHMHSCRYASEGCNEKLKYNELLAHELKCKFYKYKCMSCTYEGKFDNLWNHLKVVHSSIKLSQVKNFDFPKNSEVYVVNESIGIFHCRSIASPEAVIWRATFCGPEKRRFFCELRFKGSKYKEAIFLKRTESGNAYELKKTLEELKKFKAKAKYVTLAIASCDS